MVKYKRLNNYFINNNRDIGENNNSRRKDNNNNYTTRYGRPSMESTSINLSPVPKLSHNRKANSNYPNIQTINECRVTNDRTILNEENSYKEPRE